MANRPLASRRSGLSSGEMTGMNFRIIHSGLFFPLLFRKASTMRSRLMASARPCLVVPWMASCRSCLESWSRFNFLSIRERAGAPVLAINFSGLSSERFWFLGGRLSRISMYCFSLSTSSFWMFSLMPGWMTI